MPDSRLHQLSALGQSVWIDYLSRDLLHTGELARMMDEDAVTGVTSNPTIFQKAISQGDAYDDQMRDLLEHEEDPKEIFIALAGRDIGEACDLMRKVWDDGQGPARLGLDRGRPDARVRHRGDDRRGEAARRARRQAEPLRQDPRDEARPARDRGDDRRGPVDQRHADLLDRAAPRGDGGVHPRHRAADRGRRRPDEGRVGRELLRLARRHRGRQAARGHPELQGKLAVANAKLAYQSWKEVFAGERWDGARGPGRDEAVVPVGLDLDQEPGLPRRDVRRGPDRPATR